jgi:hypothetical protein
MVTRKSKNFPISTGNEKKRFDKSLVIPVPCEVMFNVAADVNEYKHFLPFCAVSHLVALPKSENQFFNFFGHFAGTCSNPDMGCAL